MNFPSALFSSVGTLCECVCYRTCQAMAHGLRLYHNRGVDGTLNLLRWGVYLTSLSPQEKTRRSRPPPSCFCDKMRWFQRRMLLTGNYSFVAQMYLQTSCWGRYCLPGEWSMDEPLAQILGSQAFLEWRQICCGQVSYHSLGCWSSGRAGHCYHLTPWWPDQAVWAWSPSPERPVSRRNIIIIIIIIIIMIIIMIIITIIMIINKIMIITIY